MKFLYLFVPISLILGHWLPGYTLSIFATAAFAIVPLANLVRMGTEKISYRVGSAVGGLLNVTLGNTAELVLAIFVLLAGNPGVVKAQLTGSIIGNSLLGLGLAILFGSWNREKQTFKRERAGLLSSLLILAVVALLLPAFFDYAERGVGAARGPLEEHLSLGVAAILILVYIANLIYTLGTHRDVFAFEEVEIQKSSWPVWKSIAALVVGTVLIALEAELVSRELQKSADYLGVSTYFLGITVLAIVGNAAEYYSAIYFARKDKMGLALTITVGSSIQIALLVAPLLVFISYFIGHPMNLVFGNPLELIAMVTVAFAVNSIAADGQSTWFEGVLLVALYILFALVFFLLTPAG